MGGVKMRITNPLRFFGFFGLFLVFMFMAVKSCSERKKNIEFVNAENITELTDKNTTSKEHAKFIKGVKKDIKKQDHVQKSLSVKDVEKLEDKNINKKTVKTITAKALKIKKDKKHKDTAAKPKKKIVKPATFKSNTVMVKDVGGKVDAYSKMKLKQNVKRLNSLGHGKVTVYGSYFPGEVKTKGFVRAAKIKNELIRAGLKPTISVFVLPVSQSNRAFLGKVKFSK